LKAFIKYPAAIALVLLVGYSQVFASVYKGISPNRSIYKGVDGQERVQSPATRSSLPDEIFFEEEEGKEEKDERDDKLSFRVHAKDIDSQISIYACLQNYSRLFGQRIALKHLPYLTQSGSSYLAFRVFKL